MQLSQYEKETIVNWNQAEKVAYLYSHDLPLIRKLEQWSKEHPDECRLERTSHEGQAVDYIIPKSWVHIYPPRKSAPLTEERKEQLREQLSAVRRGQ